MIIIEPPLGGTTAAPKLRLGVLWRSFGARGRGRVAWRTRCRVTFAWFWAGSGRVFAFLADLGSVFVSCNLPHSAILWQRVVKANLSGPKDKFWFFLQKPGAIWKDLSIIFCQSSSHKLCMTTLSNCPHNTGIWLA